MLPNLSPQSPDVRLWHMVYDDRMSIREAATAIGITRGRAKRRLELMRVYLRGAADMARGIREAREGVSKLLWRMPG